MVNFAMVLYVVSMTGANLLVSYFGPAITPINAFFIIGLDLVLRDYLHINLSKKKLFALLVVSALLTYIANPASGAIAIASASAFLLSSVVDWFLFTKVTGTWIKKSNISNVGGAAVDSVVFPMIAFGALLPEIVLLQFICKVSGGFIWSSLINGFALSRSTSHAAK